MKVQRTVPRGCASSLLCSARLVRQGTLHVAIQVICGHLPSEQGVRVQTPLLALTHQRLCPQSVLRPQQPGPVAMATPAAWLCVLDGGRWRIDMRTSPPPPPPHPETVSTSPHPPPCSWSARKRLLGKIYCVYLR